MGKTKPFANFAQNNVLIHTIMSTITIEYDNSSVVLDTIKQWCARGLVRIVPSETTKDEVREWTAAEEREAFLYTSKINAAKNFAHLL